MGSFFSGEAVTKIVIPPRMPNMPISIGKWWWTIEFLGTIVSGRETHLNEISFSMFLYVSVCFLLSVTVALSIWVNYDISLTWNAGPTMIRGFGHYGSVTIFFTQIYGYFITTKPTVNRSKSLGPQKNSASHMVGRLGLAAGPKIGESSRGLLMGQSPDSMGIY